MKLRQAKKIISYGRGNPEIWGHPGKLVTRLNAQKRIEKYLGGYKAIIEMGRSMNLSEGGKNGRLV